ncbi:MAG TPA: TetR/AcrR family transcriptional regulator [Casimicrobiaceae bacterium]|nr:TetR/AcrR family transcriptional regulator [Casimicrobiaceae bacterium]
MPERKRPRRTRERILETSLELFNRFGEPNVTTGDIAVEMGISPGNLYYHFRNKEEITTELYAAFEGQVQPLLVSPEARSLTVDDLWLWLHLFLEAMERYRFLYRDLVDLAARHHRAGARIAQLLRNGERTLRAIFRAISAGGDLDATGRELDVLARNAMLILTHSMAYERLARGPGASQMAPDLTRAAYGVLMLIAPHATGEARAHIERLSAIYLDGTPS